MTSVADGLSPAWIVFWACAALLGWTYLGYPALLAVLSLLRRRKNPEPGYEPTLSVVIAAGNEEKSIRRKLEQTLLLDYPPDRLEVLVVSDGSTDGTDEEVSRFTDPRVRLIRVPERRGKTNAQNVAVRECRHEVLVFSDATTVYHPRSLRYLAGNYADPSVGAVSGRYRYFDPEGRSPTGLGSRAFWSYENLIKTAQSRIGTLTGCCGCIYSVRRALYTELAPDIISDLVQPLWVIKQGRRVVFEDRALAYEETTQSTAEEFAMRVRVTTRGMRGLLSVRELLLPWRHPWVSLQLLSHKVLRWLVPLYLLGLLLSSAVLATAPFYGAAFLLQVVFYLAALVGAFVPLHRRFRPAALPLYFCILNAAALLSLVELARGRKYVAWQTVRRPSGS
jgi:cellulose synthase/poly-beta-1,6-N-acetylglucosamine synthase-like glycosyltransferase